MDVYMDEWMDGRVRRMVIVIRIGLIWEDHGFISCSGMDRRHIGHDDWYDTWAEG